MPKAWRVKDDLATVSFERNHRIAEYDLGRTPAGPQLRTLDFLVPAEELRQNRGFETVAYAPAGGRLAGARVIVSEKSLDTDGNILPRSWKARERASSRSSAATISMSATVFFFPVATCSCLSAISPWPAASRCG